MIRVRTPSRLHFGLLNPAGKTGRRFGGVGLMVQSPGIEIGLVPAASWHVCGLLAERGQLILQRLLDGALCRQVEPHCVTVRRGAPLHMGLGTGTQLALAMARAIADAAHVGRVTAVDLARWVGRGERSAIGIHGFDHGGFVVDGGKRDETVAPLVIRLQFPEPWRVVLILPPWPPGLHGIEERRAFERIPDSPPRTAELCRRLLLEVVPAVVEADFKPFADSLHRFNREAGEAYSAIQGGPYASGRVADLIAYMRGLGVAGVGQSSWGPGVFAFASDADQADWIAEKVSAEFQFPPEAIVVTAPDNAGAKLSRS